MQNENVRLDMLQAVRELNTRLKAVSTGLATLKSDICGEAECNELPEQLTSHSLDGQIFALFEPLKSIEDDLARIGNRVGCVFNTKQEPKRAVGMGR